MGNGSSRIGRMAETLKPRELEPIASTIVVAGGSDAIVQRQAVDAVRYQDLVRK